MHCSTIHEEGRSLKRARGSLRRLHPSESSENRESIAFKWERMSGMSSSEADAVAMLTFPLTIGALWEGARGRTLVHWQPLDSRPT